MLPNFVCPGTARGATTALYYLLIQHPQVFLPSIKETRFFSRDYEKGLSWYEQKYYANVKDEIAVGDISPVYLVDERCPERIHDSLGPDIGLIFMLRNPVERAYSHYCMLRNHQFEDLSFEEAIAIDEPARIAKSLKYYENEYGFQYLKESTYSLAIQRYLRYFQPDRIKYIVFEEFIADVENHLLDILGFLGVKDRYEFDLDVYKNPKTASGPSKVNQVFYTNPLVKKTRDVIQSKTSWKAQSLLKKLKTKLLTKSSSEVPAMAKKTQEELYAYFDDEIARLEGLLDKDLSVWKKQKVSV
jgi:hypothetical protein